MTQKPFLLSAEGVNKSFDGFKAINDLNFYLEPGELRTVIGPNGAGKTTFLDLITGRTQADTGTIEFEGRHNLGALSEHEIYRLGIGRKFQTPTVRSSGWKSACCSRRKPSSCSLTNRRRE
mgnify:CR=1 FL=1